jgi:hypothetical protein
MHDWPWTTGKKGIVTFRVTREQGAFLQIAEKPLALSAAAAPSQGQLVESKVSGWPVPQALSFFSRCEDFSSCR